MFWIRLTWNFVNVVGCIRNQSVTNHYCWFLIFHFVNHNVIRYKSTKWVTNILIFKNYPRKHGKEIALQPTFFKWSYVPEEKEINHIFKRLKHFFKKNINRVVTITWLREMDEKYSHHFIICSEDTWFLTWLYFSSILAVLSGLGLGGCVCYSSTGTCIRSVLS